MTARLPRRALMLAALACPLAAIAATPPPKKAPPRPAPARPAPDTAPLVRVALTTTMGVITVELNRAQAPVTASNFLRYVDQKRFDGIVFYRTMRLGTDENGQPQGLIQAGTRGDPKRVLPAIAHEPTDKTGLKHVTGALSMARWAPGTATGDFSIMVSPLHGLDANPGGTGDTAGYAVFGLVVDGMDVVRQIHAVPTSPTEGEGFLRGQMIAAPVKILTARRVPVPAVAPIPAPKP
jgi:peptidyl-prolyl cis-trans isomerase A (cyclophilin A)